MDRMSKLFASRPLLANAKGLHGKERKHFRSECKHHGGRAE
jgi:hypothetical protein